MSEDRDDNRDGQVEPANYVLDITSETCPMTFVRTRILLDRMPPGATARIRLRGAEPLRNVPLTAAALGHTVLGLEAERDTAGKPDDTWVLSLRKRG